MITIQILLICFVVNLGVAFGAGLYETRIVLPLWFRKTASNGFSVNVEAMRAIDSGRRFWGFVTTAPLTILTLTSLFFLFSTNGPLLNWWLAGTLLILAERIATFVFFIPTAMKLQKAQNLPPAKINKLVLWWTRLNLVRNTATLAGLFLFIKALLSL